jgi:hypothetical protein
VAVRKWMLGTLAVGALSVAGCSSGAGSSPLNHNEQLTSKACRDIVSTMSPHTGTALIPVNFQELVVAVDDSPSARLHSELAAFQYDADHAASGANFVSDASAMLRTCEQLGLGGSGAS